MKRGILIGIGALVAVIVIAVVSLVAGLDSLIKGGIESYGPEMTQSDVDVDDVEVSPASGEGSIKGMSVDNPDGFESERAFSLGSIELAIDTASVTEDVITIKKIAIRQPEITYEIQKGGRTNFDALMENVNAYVDDLTGGGAGGADTENDDTPAAEGESRKFIVEDFLLEDGKVSVVAQGLGLGEISASLPRIHMTDIGKQKGGADAGEIVQIVLTKVQNGALRAVQALDINQLNNLLKDPKALLDQGLKGLNVQGEKGQAVKDAEQAIEGFKSLFGK